VILPDLQPNAHYCFVCGLSNPLGLKLRFYQVSPGEVFANVIIPEEYQSFPGGVHGGIIAAILDEAAGRSQMYNDPSRDVRFMFTANMQIHYRKNVPTGKPLKLVGIAGKTKQRSAQARAEIHGPEGDLLAEADLVLVDLPDRFIETNPIDQTNWQVYPE
jgi:acyl-coenzyme A thioesterase PaaI-like protein